MTSFAERWTPEHVRGDETICSGGVLPPRDRDDAGAGDLDQADLAHQRNERVDLLATAGHLEHEARGGRVDHAGAVDIGAAERLDAMLAGAGDLQQGQLAFDMRAE